MQTEVHVDAVALFSGYIANGAAGPLNDFATQTLPTLKMHYEHALTLPH
jgi:putative membrane protein